MVDISNHALLSFFGFHKVYLDTQSKKKLSNLKNQRVQGDFLQPRPFFGGKISKSKPGTVELSSFHHYIRLDEQIIFGTKFVKIGHKMAEIWPLLLQVRAIFWPFWNGFWPFQQGIFAKLYFNSIHYVTLHEYDTL